MNLEKQIVEIIKQLQEEKALADKRIKQLFLEAAAHASSHEIGGGDLVDHDNLTNFAAGEHFLQSAITVVGTIATGIWNGTPLTTKYYKPYSAGATRGSAFTSTTVGSYVSTAVHIPYTPAFNCLALITCHWHMKRSVSGDYMVARIYDATLGGLASGYHDCIQSSEYLSFSVTREVDLTASTAYDFILQVYQPAAGTMTVLQNPYTYMTLLVFGR